MRGRGVLGGLGILLLGWLVLGAWWVWWATDPGADLSGSPEPPPGQVPEDAVELEVTRVIDGDTLDAVPLTDAPDAPRTDGGTWREGERVRVRLLLVDTPERGEDGRNECYYQEAADRLAALAPVGSRVWAQNDDEPTDQYGRALAYLWNADGELVNLVLVREGYAEAVLFEPNDRHIDLVRAAEQEARDAGRGLWGACR